MFDLKPLAGKRTLCSLLFLIFFFNINNLGAQNADAGAGRTLFQNKCASCHNIFKETAYPALKDLEQRHKWSDHNELLKWVHNPAAYIGADKTGYTAGLVAKYKSMMPAFPDLKIEDVDNIVAYINDEVTKAAAAPAGGGEAQSKPYGKDNSNAVIFGVISLILAIIAMIMMQVNSNLKKMSDDAEGIRRPEPVPFYRNKIYIAMAAIVFFTIAGYYISKAAIGLGRQTGRYR